MGYGPQDTAGYIEQRQQALKRFGAMLRNWREQNGWTQHTASRWGKEAGFKALDAGTLSKIESAKVPSPRQTTFFQLADVNRRIAGQEWGRIRTGQLRDQVTAAKAIIDEHGHPWGPKEFWAASVGLQVIPPGLVTTELVHLTQQTAARLSRQWREMFQDVVMEHDLDPATVLSKLVKGLTAEQRKRAGQVLLMGAEFSVEELQEQWDGRWPLEVALGGWMQQPTEEQASDGKG